MSQSGIYNESKLTWWYAREQKLPDVPKQVQVILSDLCNQDCHFCAYRMSGYSSNQLFMGDSEPAKIGHNNPKRMIPRERALALLDEIKSAGCLSVQFTGGGEPTVHPDHEEIFSKALNLGLNCSLVSNGIKWSDNLIKNILPHFDWVRVSVDAADKDSYAATRRVPVAHWDKAWKSVNGLTEAIAIQRAKTTFGLSFVVTPESWPDILQFAYLALDAGVSNVRFTAMFSTDNEEPFLKTYDRIKLLIDKAKGLATNRFHVYDNFGSRFNDLKQHSPDYRTCSYQHYTTYVGGDLNAYRCCVLAYNKRGKIAGGDLKTRRFDEFWNSDDRKKDFDRFNAKGCARCQFNTKNRSVLYLMEDKPEHIQWP